MVENHCMTACSSLCSYLTCLRLAGVRARQEKVPFATCEDEDTLQEEVRSLLGEPVP